MKLIKIFFLLLALGLPAFGQQVSVTANRIRVETPSGPCFTGSVRITTAGVIWTCQLGTWAVGGGGSSFTSAVIVTSNANPCFAVGPNGATNPTLAVKCDVASQATGLILTGAAAGTSGTTQVTSSGINEGWNWKSKGTGILRVVPDTAGAGTFLIGSTSDTAGAQLSVYSQSTTRPGLKLMALSGTATTQNVFENYDASGTLNTRIIADGSIGVNVVPAYPLHVERNTAGGVEVARFRNNSSGGVGGFNFSNDSATLGNGLGLAGTTVGAPYSDNVILYTDSSAGSRNIRLLARGSSAGIDFYTGGTTLRWSINSAGLLQGGGATSSFPALKRSSATLQARLADDSGYADIASGSFMGNGATIGTSGVGVLAIANGTAPTSSPADEFQLYSADSAAGDANAFSRNEAGEINRLTGLAARNSSSFAKTSDTTLANITGLTRNVEASRVYAFTAIIQTTAAATGGVKFAISGTATATAISYEGILISGAAIVAQTRATALDTTVCASTTTTAGTCKISGVIQINAAGTLTIQFAQNASDAGASSVLANQFLQLIPIN